MNEKVTVHDPQWRDAAGNIYGPGKRHGMTGVIVRRTGYKCGSNEIVEVDFGPHGIFDHWTEDLIFEKREAKADAQERLI